MLGLNKRVGSDFWESVVFRCAHCRRPGGQRGGALRQVEAPPLPAAPGQAPAGGWRTRTWWRRRRSSSGCGAGCPDRDDCGGSPKTTFPVTDAMLRNRIPATG